MLKLDTSILQPSAWNPEAEKKLDRNMCNHSMLELDPLTLQQNLSDARPMRDGGAHLRSLLASSEARRWSMATRNHWQRSLVSASLVCLPARLCTFMFILRLKSCNGEPHVQQLELGTWRRFGGDTLKSQCRGSEHIKSPSSRSIPHPITTSDAKTQCKNTAKAQKKLTMMVFHCQGRCFM